VKTKGAGRQHVEVVVVVAGDGEVPHPAVVDRWHRAAVGGGGRAVGGLEVLALLQLGGGAPQLQGRLVDCTN
jgi:hypothetical protein